MCYVFLPLLRVGLGSATRHVGSEVANVLCMFCWQDLPHEERERSGVSNYQGRGKPLPNPAATVFIGNVGCDHWMLFEYISTHYAGQRSSI